MEWQCNGLSCNGVVWWCHSCGTPWGGAPCCGGGVAVAWSGGCAVAVRSGGVAVVCWWCGGSAMVWRCNGLVV